MTAYSRRRTRRANGDLSAGDPHNRVLNLPVLFERLKVWQGLKVAGGALDRFRNVSEVILDAFRVLPLVKGKAQPRLQRFR
jgi:hypothetical protein